MKALEKYLFLNLGYYFDGLDFNINIFLLAIALGMCIACVLVTVNKRNMTLIIKQLIRHEAYDENSAKSLDEIKIQKSFKVRSSLSHIGQLTHIVKVCGGYPFEKKSEGKDKKEEKLNFDTARFYICEAGRDRAMRITEQKEPSYLNTVLGCILIMMIFVSITLLVPEILYLITGLSLL